MVVRENLKYSSFVWKAMLFNLGHNLIKILQSIKFFNKNETC